MNPEDRYLEWWRTITPADRELQMDAFRFEDTYFADLRLESRSIRRKLLRLQIQGADGKWYDTEDCLDDIVSVEDWIFRYRRFRGALLGRCDSKRRTIYIRPGLDPTEHRAVLLHELIHAYEGQLPGPFREWLLLDLHERMRKRISPARLSRYVRLSTHTLYNHCSHGVLFLLKSLDLDLRFRWKLGMVFGYGREDVFRGL